MARLEGFLIDTSAAARIARSAVVDEWREAVLAGRIGMCGITRRELLYSARSAAEFKERRSEFELMYTWWSVPDSLEADCDEIQAQLAEAGAHRSAGPVDLVVAAVARHHRLTLLHYDRDLETIGRVTGQSTRWLAEPGSIP